MVKATFIDTLKNPIGLSAGFDKTFNKSPSYYAEQGFGWVEYGTVTYNPHEGNPNQKLIESPLKDYLINNYGLPNKGIKHLPKWQGRPITTGLSIGFNPDTHHPCRDFRNCIEHTEGYFDYYTVNLSCPNISKRYQTNRKLDLLTTICKISEEYHYPIMLKLAPNMPELELVDICELAIKYSIAGLIATNTKALTNDSISGSYLFEDANNTLETLNIITQGEIPLIGSGGILSVEDANHKIKLGAKAIQVYTGYHYHGKRFITELKNGVAKSPLSRKSYCKSFDNREIV